MLNCEQQSLFPIRPALPELEASILAVLDRDARGWENAIPMADLAAHLEISTRDLQAAVQRLIADYGRPI